MKSITPLAFIILLSFYSINLFAGDIYAEYKMKGIGDKLTISKLYFKNGDMRSEVNMNIAGRQMTSVTLNLKSNTEFTIAYNSNSKTYTEVKKDNNNSKTTNLSIAVIGNEKIGIYNCKHVRMTSDTTSWDMWVTKDLPAFNFPLERNNEAANRKIMELLKSKSADGVPVKIEFLKQGTKTQGITMELVKFESKTLDESLFKIPDDYVKSNLQFDAEKMKSMTPEERQEMIKKLMEENMPHK